jgi:hypothetical protein
MLAAKSKQQKMLTSKFDTETVDAKYIKKQKLQKKY